MRRLYSPRVTAYGYLRSRHFFVHKKTPPLGRGYNTHDWRSVILSTSPVIQLVIVCLVVPLRTTERTPVLVTGEGVAPTAGIACSGVGHVVKYKTC